MACADLDRLVFLPSGDAALTRRARKHSTLSPVVLRFSRARKRHERQGLLVEEDALDPHRLPLGRPPLQPARQIHRRTSPIIGIGQYFVRLGTAEESIHTYQPPDQCGGEIWIYGTKRNEILLS